jgi:hypothetical protein
MAEDADWGRQIAENVRRSEELFRRVTAMSITEASRDGTVRVTVSANGVLTDVVLTERRQFAPMAQVGAEIMRCVRRAQARIPELMRQAMAETMGTPDAGAQQVLADAQARFPAAPPEPPIPRGQASRPPAAPSPALPPPPRPPARLATGRRPTPRDDSDWDSRQILEDVDGDGR